MIVKRRPNGPEASINLGSVPHWLFLLQPPFWDAEPKLSQPAPVHLTVLQEYILYLLWTLPRLSRGILNVFCQDNLKLPQLWKFKKSLGPRETHGSEELQSSVSLRVFWNDEHSRKLKKNELYPWINKVSTFIECYHLFCKLTTTLTKSICKITEEI